MNQTNTKKQIPIYVVHSVVPMNFIYTAFEPLFEREDTCI